MSGVTAPPSLPQASLVHTTETIRIRYFLDLLVEKSWPVMLVGNAGTGKSVLMGDKLGSLSTDDWLVQAVPFNFYTTSAMLQGEAEDKRASSQPGLDTPHHSHPTRLPPSPTLTFLTVPSYCRPGSLPAASPLPMPPPTALYAQSRGTRVADPTGSSPRNQSQVAPRSMSTRFLSPCLEPVVPTTLSFTPEVAGVQPILSLVPRGYPSGHRL